MRRQLIILLTFLLWGCSGGGGGSSCTNEPGNGCDLGEYCLFDPGTCGPEGKCEKIPDACDINLTTPVCSCEGISFFNDCFAAQAGQSVKAAGDCPNV